MALFQVNEFLQWLDVSGHAPQLHTPQHTHINTPSDAALPCLVACLQEAAEDDGEDDN